MEKKYIIDFAQIFYFAEKEYGIGWNEANHIFFNGVLEYGKHTSVDVGSWIEYIDEKIEEKKHAGDYTKEEVLAMTDNDKSYIITHAYLETQDLKDGDEVLVNSS